MMQAFYWDVPAGGNWWNTSEYKSNRMVQCRNRINLVTAGIKSTNGPFYGIRSIDYFDFETATKWNSRNLALVPKQNYKLNYESTPKTYARADMVLNHNSGGQPE
jgi:alpha-amylase